MAGQTSKISIRMDSELKTQADDFFAELGMDISTAFTLFVRQSLREGKIPFEISLNLSYINKTRTWFMMLTLPSSGFGSLTDLTDLSLQLTKFHLQLQLSILRSI